MCPRISAIEYHSNGAIKRLELVVFEVQNMGKVVYDLGSGETIVRLDNQYRKKAKKKSTAAKK